MLISSKVHQISVSAKSFGVMQQAVQYHFYHQSLKKKDFGLNSGRHLAISVILGLCLLLHGSNDT